MVNIKVETMSEDIREYWKVYYEEKRAFLSFKKRKLYRVKKRYDNAIKEGNEKKIKQFEKQLKKSEQEYEHEKIEFEKIEKLNDMFNEEQFYLKKVMVPDELCDSMLEKECIVFNGTGYVFKPTSSLKMFYNNVQLVKE